MWTKEILQIFDNGEARTRTEEKLRQMLEMRHTETPSEPDTFPSTEADKNGLILALSCTVPFRYRKVLRDQKVLESLSLEELEKRLFIPAEKIKFLLAEEFEEQYEQALEG